MKISRNIPPAAPVMEPMIMFTQIGKPASRLFSTTTVKSPIPMASKMKKVLSRRTSLFLNRITKIRATAVMMT